MLEHIKVCVNIIKRIVFGFVKVQIKEIWIVEDVLYRGKILV